MALLRSAPVQGVSRPPHAASRDCRNGSPLARAIPCAPAPECEEPVFLVCTPTRSAASRDGMAGWAGEGGGRFGERREYEAPTLPSTPRQHGAARHHNSQAKPDQTRPSQTRPSQTRPSQTRPSHDNTPHHTTPQPNQQNKNGATQQERQRWTSTIFRMQVATRLCALWPAMPMPPFPLSPPLPGMPHAHCFF